MSIFLDLSYYYIYLNRFRFYSRYFSFNILNIKALTILIMANLVNKEFKFWELVLPFIFNEFSFILRATHSPWGSTSLASFSASEFARSVLAGVTARIRQFSRVMNCMIISLIWCSISAGWSPTGTLVIPGRSIKVRFNTVQTGKRVLCIPSVLKDINYSESPVIFVEMKELSFVDGASK